jgi:hypothetical protein
MEDTERGEPITEETAPPAGLWECLNEPRNCTLAAPDPRSRATLFEGPAQGAVSGPVTCPECGGQKVIYRGEKTDAAAAA